MRRLFLQRIAGWKMVQETVPATEHQSPKSFSWSLSMLVSMVSSDIHRCDLPPDTAACSHRTPISALSAETRGEIVT
jgi:hypothetical protein